MAYLVLVRHGISAWNAAGLWAGWEDVPLTNEGNVISKEIWAKNSEAGKV